MPKGGKLDEELRGHLESVTLVLLFRSSLPTPASAPALGCSTASSSGCCAA